MSRPLRLGLFVMMFPQLSETFIVTKFLKLLDAGFDVHVFAQSESPHWDAFDVLRGREDVRTRVHVLPPTRPLQRVLSGGIPFLLKRALTQPVEVARYASYTWSHRKSSRVGFLKSLYLRSHFVGQELDILHVEFDAQGLGVVDLKEFLGCHLLYSARGTFQQTTVLDNDPDAPSYLFRFADGYHFISRFLEDNTRKLGLPREIPTWLIEPAIDLTLFAPRSRVLSKPLRLVSVGRLSWAKGYEFALDAVALIRDVGIDFTYTIYGSGPYAEPIRFAIHQLDLEDYVKLAGSLRREDMPAAYQDADVMIHAAVEEGFCNAVIEAQAMELPVVTSDAGGLPENVEHEVTGFVVPRRDAAAMAARIVELARDPALRVRLGRAGRDRALARFDLDRQAEKFVQLYTELAAQPLRPIG